MLVNALPLRRGGGITYLERQMDALARVAPCLDVHTLVSPWGQLSGLPGRTEILPLKSVPARFAYELFRLPFRRTDLLYCPANFGPVVHGAPMVLTLHNPNYYGTGLTLAEAKPSRPWWKIKANYAAMRRADAIIAISHSFAEEVASTVPGIAHKISVIYSGGPEWPEGSVPVKGLPEQYILAVTSSAPHKRLEDLIEGWSRSLTQSEHMSLVIAGQFSDDQVRAHKALARGHEDKLVHVGQVRDRRALKAMFEQATALVTMSLLESFSMTLSEAGAVGCPLVVSDIPAHREMSLGNALFVPPKDAAGLAEILASRAYGWAPGSRLWQWPETWEDNALALAKLFSRVASGT